MSTARDGHRSPGVLRQLDQENSNVITPRTGGRKIHRRRKSGAGFAVFQDRNGASTPSKHRNDDEPPHILVALARAEAETSRYQEELRRSQASVQARDVRVQELKAANASTNQRYAALLKSHEEATKELGLLRSMADNSECLREDRDSLEARLAERDAVVVAMKREADAAEEREASLRDDLVRARDQLEKAAQDATDQLDEQNASSVGASEDQWSLGKAVLEAQLKELEEQLSTSQRRCAAIAAERAVLAQEATRREHDHGVQVTALQEELHSLQNKTAADLGDWQSRHQEAVGAKRAAQDQLGRLVRTSQSIAQVAERQAVLELSLREACGLLSQTVLAEAEESRPAMRTPSDQGAECAQRAVEGVMEHILGRVFEGSHVKEEVKGALERNDEDTLQEEGLVLLGQTLEKLTADMENLRAFGVAEAEAYLQQSRSLEIDLGEVREHHAAAVSELEAARAKSQEEVERLTQSLSDGERERKELTSRLETAANELATTVQLSEMALATKDPTDDSRLEEEKRRGAEEAQQRIGELEAQKNASLEELEFERHQYAERVTTLQGENSILQEKVRALSAQASALQAKASSSHDASPQGRLRQSGDVSDEARAVNEDKFQDMEGRLRDVMAENELARKMETAVAGGNGALSPASDRGQSRVAMLEAEVASLTEQIAAEREVVTRAREDDRLMRKYVLHYHTRTTQKMKEMQRHVDEVSAGRAADGTGP